MEEEKIEVKDIFKRFVRWYSSLEKKHPEIRAIEGSHELFLVNNAWALLVAIIVGVLTSIYVVCSNSSYSWIPLGVFFSQILFIFVKIKFLKKRKRLSDKS